MRASRLSCMGLHDFEARAGGDGVRCWRPKPGVRIEPMSLDGAFKRVFGDEEPSDLGTGWVSGVVSSAHDPETPNSSSSGPAGPPTQRTSS